MSDNGGVAAAGVGIHGRGGIIGCALDRRRGRRAEEVAGGPGSAVRPGSASRTTFRGQQEAGEESVDQAVVTRPGEAESPEEARRGVAFINPATRRRRSEQRRGVVDPSGGGGASSGRVLGSVCSE
jgi:hypothetical protein